MNYIGAITMAPICLILPGMYYLCTLKKGKVRGSCNAEAGAWFVIVFGVVAMVITIGANVMVSLGAK